jgi:CubicO group peptidase (beta-lactamase class C family)
MSYDDYVKKHIFEPAGMKLSQLDHFRVIIPNRTRGYMKLDQETYAMLSAAQKRKFRAGEIFNAALHDTSMKVPGGGLVSTSEDLVRFVIAINTNILIKEKTRELMWTRQKRKDGRTIDYAMGWNIEQDEGGPMLISHGGNQAGTSTFFVTIPQAKLSVAVMGNLEGVNMKNIARKVGMAVLQANSD